MHNISLKYSRIGHKPEVFWLGFTRAKNNLVHTYTMLNLPMICFAPKLTPPEPSYISSRVKAGKLGIESIIKTNWISLNSKAKDGSNSFTFITSPLFSSHKGSLYAAMLTHAGPRACQPPTLGFNPETLPAHCKNHCRKHTKKQPAILICRTQNILTDDAPVTTLHKMLKFNGLCFVGFFWLVGVFVWICLVCGGFFHLFVCL